MTRETPAEPWLTTPRAILLGAFVIAAFAYAGLRDRPASAPLAAVSPSASLHDSAGRSASSPPPPVEPSDSSRGLAAAPTIVPLEVTPSAAPLADLGTVEASVRKALAEHLPALKQACWKARPPEARVTYSMNVSFDATGRQLARGLSEPRLPEAERIWVAGLARCIAEKLPPLSIDPPGANVQVEIPIGFP